MRSLLVAILLSGAEIAVASPAAAQAPCTGDRPAQMAADSPQPVYPPMLKAAGVKGEVVAQFVVGTSGVPDTLTLKVVKSTDSQFVGAVRRALPSLRFAPACINGTAVRQLVQVPFVFEPPLPAPPDSATVAVRHATLKLNLKSYSTAQEALFVNHARYANSVGELGPLFRATPGVIVVVLTAGADANGAIAIDREFTDPVCAIDYGSPGKSVGAFGASTQGAPACKGPWREQKAP